MGRVEVDLKAFGFAAMICILAGGALWWFAGMPFLAAVLVAAFAILVNGLIAHLEDKPPDVGKGAEDEHGH